MVQGYKFMPFDFICDITHKLGNYFIRWTIKQWMLFFWIKVSEQDDREFESTAKQKYDIDYV